jgi:ubiquinone/menaquinone biosynthesis C-methylase UbiE
MEHKKTVREGYNAIAIQYLEARTKKSADMLLLDDFMQKLPAKARVLDAGCGAGIPVAKTLSERFDVTGVDFSETQIKLAKENVPGATFICQDMTQLKFPANSFDGICSFYAIIHVPREEHRALLENFYRVLKPEGLALLCLGAEDLPDDIEEDFHGQRMYWSHYDAATYQSMLKEIGFSILSAKIVPDETYDGQHLFVLVQKGNSPK